jgi:nucleotide-binding universal stress UspA family protein
MSQTFQKILCPIDFDENSMAALDLACRIAAQNKATIRLLHVLPLPATAADIGPVPLEPYGVFERDARMKLEQIGAERVPADVPCEVETGVGGPAQSIVAAEEKYGIDLVVMATHGRKRSAVGHFFLGSVAERVVRESQCAVLVVPPK